MKFQTAVLFAMALSLVSAHAQGIVGGAQQGSANGEAVAGPVGAVVGEAVGAVTGGVAGLLGIDQIPRFRDYILRERHTSIALREGTEITRMAALPSDGVIIKSFGTSFRI